MRRAACVPQDSTPARARGAERDSPFSARARPVVWPYVIACPHARIVREPRPDRRSMAAPMWWYNNSSHPRLHLG